MGLTPRDIFLQGVIVDGVYVFLHTLFGVAGGFPVLGHLGIRKKDLTLTIKLKEGKR